MLITPTHRPTPYAVYAAGRGSLTFGGETARRAEAALRRAGALRDAAGRQLVAELYVFGNDAPHGRTVTSERWWAWLDEFLS